MIKYLLLIIITGSVQLSVYAQSTWVKIQPGMNNLSSLLIKDTLITVGNGGDKMNNFLIINYSFWETGNLLQNDTNLFVPERINLESPWNILFANYDDFMAQFNNDVYIGFNYMDSSGTSIKWRSSVYSLSKNTSTNIDVNVDTFNNVFIGIYNVNDKIFVTNQWKDPDQSGKSTPNFEISSIDKSGNKTVVYQAINKNRGTWNMIRGIQDDNQSDDYFFINRERAWDFAGVPLQFEFDIMKMDTTGEFIWSSKLNYTDSLNMVGCEFIQKDNGNLLAMWNNMYYRPYKKPSLRSGINQPNDSSTLCMAEVDYKTGKVIKRRSYRKFLQKQRTHGYGFTKSETPQDFKIEKAIKVKNGIIWAGTRTLFQKHKQVRSISMPFLFKADFSGNPIWYRDYFVFPDSETDEGMLVSSILQTPDGGFVMAGENRDYSRSDVQRSILMKVDSFGCLIPGCQLKDNINETLVRKCELYPNPTNSSFTITLPKSNDAWTYQILDNTGKILGNGLFDQEQNQVSTQNLPKGIYQIILQNSKLNHYENHSFIIAK